MIEMLSANIAERRQPCVVVPLPQRRLRARVYIDADLASWKQKGAAGLTPGLAPYGLEHLDWAGVDLGRQRPPAWMTAPRVHRLRKAVANRVMPLFHPLTLACGEQPDVAVAVLEKQGLLHALLKQARVSPWAETPLVLIACWLADDARTASAGKLALLRRVAQSADLIVYWSSNQQAIYTDLLRVPEERLMFVPFGVEDSFYRPASSRTTERYLFSAGLDKGRDYPTLIEALNEIDMPVRIAAPERAFKGLRLADNIEPLRGVWGRDYLDQLSNATAVVIASCPEIAYPTGQTVILNAMATGVPVVATDTLPLRDYLRHEENALLAPPRDPAGLRAQVFRLLEDSALGHGLAKNGLEDVRERFNSRAMWQTVAKRLAQL